MKDHSSVTVIPPTEIKPFLYWVGKTGIEGELDCNPYLLIDHDEAVLFDPGSVQDFDVVLKNVESLISLEQIKLIVLHHQDPDLCGSLTLFEKAGVHCPMALHWRTSVMVKYYGVENPFYCVNENQWTWSFSSGKVLQFLAAPYCHFPGAILTYDPKTKVLFSGDLFGAFEKNSSGLYAGETYLEAMKTFHEHYIPSREVLSRVMENLNPLDIEIIAPQHGRIINQNPGLYIHTLSRLSCGVFSGDYSQEGDRKELSRSVVSTLLNRLYLRAKTLFPEEEIQELIERSPLVFEGDTIKFDKLETQEAMDLLLELFTSKPRWFTILNPYLLSQFEELNIPLPEQLWQQGGAVNSVNPAVSAISHTLDQQLREAEKSILTDSLTELFNQTFFQTYIEGLLSRENPTEFGLFYISIDNLIQINQIYDRKTGDETLKSFGYLLKRYFHEIQDVMLFKLNAPVFTVVMESVSFDDLLLNAEQIIRTVRNSSYFAESLQISIGLSHSGEWKDQRDSITFRELDQLTRAKQITAKERGSGNICKFLKGLQPEVVLQKRVLFVEPDDSYIHLIRSELESRGIQVILVQDGDLAMERREGWNPDLIVAEAMTPKVNGFQLKEKLGNLTGRADTPFILMSQRKDEEFILRASKLGITHYLKKPFSLSELKGLIINLLES